MFRVIQDSYSQIADCFIADGLIGDFLWELFCAQIESAKNYSPFQIKPLHFSASNIVLSILQYFKSDAVYAVCLPDPRGSLL